MIVDRQAVRTIAVGSQSDVQRPETGVSRLRSPRANNNRNKNNNKQPTVSCRTCNRTFSSQQAFDQHFAEVHYKAKPANMAAGSRRAPGPRRARKIRSERPIRVTGRRGLARVGERYGITRAGEEWAVRAISPCDERLQEGRQIPDLAGTTSAVITQRIITAITPPTMTGTDSTWNLLVVTPPIPDVAFMFKRWSASADPGTLDWEVVVFRDVIPGRTNLAIASHLVDTYAFPFPGETNTILNSAEQYRVTQKGHTLNLNASALYNGGMILAGQYGDKMYIKGDMILQGDDAFITSPNSVPVENMGSILVIDDIPASTEEIFAKDPHAMRAPARFGCYLPLKFNDPVSPYSATVSNAYYSDDGTTVIRAITGPLPVYERKYRGDAIANATQFKPIIWGEVDPLANYRPVLSSVGTTNTQTGVIYCEGLDVKASIDIKTVAALEVVASGTSPWTGFMKDCPEEDDVVQKQVHSVQRRMDSAYPASYNLVGTLLSSVLPALGGIAVNLVKGLWTKYVSGPRKRAAVRAQFRDEDVD